ncbi:MAG: hypothetical protein E7549_08855, partial [Ruminococcaceae bacterium]|nr:hypothetical protein [Oscillospiraceae bacterium]
MRRVIGLVCGFLLALGMIPLSVAADAAYDYAVADGEAVITAVDPYVSGAVTVPATLGGYPVTGIDEWAFYGCGGMTSLTLPQGVEWIGNDAFSECVALATVSIPDSVSEIGDGAFAACTALKTVRLPAGLTAVGASLFSDCTALTEVTVPSGVTTIGEFAFSNTALTAVQLPAGVAQVGAYAFAGCALTKITLPRSLKTVGADAFFRCDALADVYYGGTESDRAAITVGTGNEALTGAAWHYGLCLDGHTVENGVITVRPTYTATGVRTGTCAVCGEVVSETLPALGIEGLPEPYAWMQVKYGEIFANCTVGVRGDASGLTPAAVGNTGESGLPLLADWSGFYLSGELLADVPADRSVTVLIEYYTVGDAKGQMFRYVPYDGAAQVDMFTDRHGLSTNRWDLVYHTFTAEERAAIGTGDARFAVLGCSAGAKNTYIRSVMIVDTAYLNQSEDIGCAYIDFEQQIVCDYYPAITRETAFDMNYRDLEPNTDGVNLYRYFNVFGEALRTDKTVNVPMYLRFYAAEGYENAKIALNAYEVSNGEKTNFNGIVGYPPYTITMRDGVGDLILPAACFTNGLNGAGSFRFWHTDAPKIARVEVYTVETYCAKANADAARCATVHAWTAENGVYAERVSKAPTCAVDGYADALVCTVCGDVLAAGEVLPKLDHVPGELIGYWPGGCLEDGYTGDAYCDVCGEQIVFGEVIPAPGEHTWDDGVITIAPTTEATGVKTYTCTVCGATKTEVLPMLGKEYTYTIADGKVTITKVDTAIRGDVVIPSVIEGYPVTEIAVNAFKGCVNITSLTIPESIE